MRRLLFCEAPMSILEEVNLEKVNFNPTVRVLDPEGKEAQVEKIIAILNHFFHHWLYFVKIYILRQIIQFSQLQSLHVKNSDKYIIGSFLKRILYFLNLRYWLLKQFRRPKWDPSPGAFLRNRDPLPAPCPADSWRGCLHLQGEELGKERDQGGRKPNLRCWEQRRGREQKS